MANGCIGRSDGQAQVNRTFYEHGIFRDIRFVAKTSDEGDIE